MGGAADDVQYSLRLLRALGQDLEGLVQSFEGRAGRVAYGEHNTGHRRVLDALDDFAGSWDDHREGLTHSLSSLADMARRSAEAFAQVDRDLATQIRDAVRG